MAKKPYSIRLNFSLLRAMQKAAKKNNRSVNAEFETALENHVKNERTN